MTGVDRGRVWPPPKYPDFSMELEVAHHCWWWRWTATTLVGPGTKCLCSTGYTRAGTARSHRRRLRRDHRR